MGVVFEGDVEFFLEDVSPVCVFVCGCVKMV